MNKTEFEKEYTDFIREWANEVWKWANANGTFYKDGIFDFDTWFDEENKFRPLFILKEVHEKDDEKQPENSNGIVDFVSIGEKGSDPWQGTGMWKRLGVFAAAMFKMFENGGHIPEYDTMYENYSDTDHQEICKKIAMINLKKLAGGSSAGSKESKRTLCFGRHARRFYDKLMKQIGMIQPDVIICCGKNSVIECLDINKDDTVIEITNNGKSRMIPIINGYHPRQNSTENFYYGTLTKMKEQGIFNSGNQK